VLLRVLLLEAAALALLAVAGYWLWDRRRYRGAVASGDRLEPTAEVFVDPASGRRVRVFFDPRSGRRVYRDAGDPDPPA
jgi:uncharacterized iron-regulated membrane protein